MATLTESFRSPTSRVTRVMVVIRLVNSTVMKQQGPEAAWLPTYGWFFDLLTETIPGFHGILVKYIDNGAVATFNDDQATDAINWAIRVQEEILAAQDSNVIACDCSIGIACGSVVRFQTPLGNDDYIGEVADRAFLLCLAANGKAVFVDHECVLSASMGRVISRVGELPPRRRPNDYLGDLQTVTGGGFQKPVGYHELLWAKARYGVSAPFVSDLTKQVDKQLSSPALFTERSTWMKGRVKTFNVERGYGFIDDEHGESFWFNAGCCFNNDAIPGYRDDVWFIPKEPLPNARNRRATDVVSLGSSLSGELDKVFPQGYGFAGCITNRNERRLIFVNLGNASQWKIGDQIEFTVGENSKGMAGDNPRMR